MALSLLPARPDVLWVVATAARLRGAWESALGPPLGGGLDRALAGALAGAPGRRLRLALGPAWPAGRLYRAAG